MMMAGAGMVAPFMLTVTSKEVLLLPSATLTEILVALTVPVTEPLAGIGLSP